MEKTRRLLRILAVLLYISSLLLLIRFVFLKHAFYVIRNHFNLYYSFDTILDGIKNANLLPFKSIMAVFSNSNAYEFPINNNLGNIAGFIPQGFLLAFIYPGFRKFWQNTKAVLITSFIFELLQLITGLGIFDIDDLLLNITGGIIGWLIFNRISKYLQKFSLIQTDNFNQSSNQ
jgi:glycopeptide antibiotics resistance protein